jgi:hypothetical protein
MSEPANRANRRAGRRERGSAGEHQGAAVKKPVGEIGSANGAASYQPGATPQEQCPRNRQGLRARPNDCRPTVGPGFQPSWIGETVTQGVALGWYETGALPLRNKPTAALDAESAEVLGNIEALL